MSEATSTEQEPPALSRLARAIQEDLTGIHLRLQLANMAARLMPHEVACLTRGRLLAMAGFAIGAGTIFRGRPHINGARTLYANLSIGRDCMIGVGCTFDLQDRLSIGDQVTIGHEVMLLTSSHDIGPKEHRAGAMQRAPITIGAGAWLGPRCVILPGVTVGAGAVVAAGALVNKDVPPNTRVAGLPAKPTEELA